MSDLTGNSSQDSSDSEGDESICRSPAKSPLKLSEVLKRKRRVSEESEEDLEDENDLDEEDIVGSSKSAQKIPTDQDFQFKEPKFRKKKFIFHPYVRTLEGQCCPDNTGTRSPVEITIPEQLAASYGLYIWPSSPVLAWYLWLHQDNLITSGTRVLELGSGTALPGLLLAKLGCCVTLSDSVSLPHCVQNCKEAVGLNNLEESVKVIALSWGFVTTALLGLRNKLDLIVGSDLFFDPSVFEALIVTIKWLLDNNKGAKFLCTVQERSADWSIELLLKKYSLKCSYEYPSQFLAGSGINESDLTGNHTIFLLKIFQNETQT